MECPSGVASLDVMTEDYRRVDYPQRHPDTTGVPEHRPRRVGTRVDTRDSDGSLLVHGGTRDPFSTTSRAEVLVGGV